MQLYNMFMWSYRETTACKCGDQSKPWHHFRHMLDMVLILTSFSWITLQTGTSTAHCGHCHRTRFRDSFCLAI